MNKQTLYKIAFTVLFAALLALCFVFSPSIAGGAADDGVLSSLQAKLNDRLGTAALIFAATKITAGVLAFFQSISVDVGVLVAGVNVSPLKVLEPVSGTLNTLSSIFLVAMGAIVLQKFLMTITVWATLYIILPAAFAMSIASIWVKGEAQLLIRKIAIFLGCASIFASLAIPCSVELANIVENHFMRDTVTQTVANVENNANMLESFKNDIYTSDENSASATDSDKGWWERAKDKLSLSNLSTYLTGLATKVQTVVESSIRELVNMLIVMLITTVLIPIGTMYMLYRILKWAMNLVTNPVLLDITPYKASEYDKSE